MSAIVRLALDDGSTVEIHPATEQLPVCLVVKDSDGRIAAADLSEFEQVRLSEALALPAPKEVAR